ncbi:hypothetical protein B0H13DRAFT_2328537 [Mycena leptocephala]|nr:hypothetical protein B0H13DRAFT_2328537 [Mycena leptocephala]
MMIITAVILGIVGLVYLVLTLLPLLYFNCPYRTPLSGAFWSIMQFVKRLWGFRRPPTKAAAKSSGSQAPESLPADEVPEPPRYAGAFWSIMRFVGLPRRPAMKPDVESSPPESPLANKVLEPPGRTPWSGAFWSIMLFLASLRLPRRSRTAVGVPASGSLESQLSEQVLDSRPSTDESMVEAMSRTAMENTKERDQHALVWTMKSLVDEDELEPFVEAIPDLLWGPKNRRQGYKDYILHLLHSCDTGILLETDSDKRRINCYKALWAIATLSKPTPSSEESRVAVDFSHIYHKFTLETTDPAAPYFRSAAAMMQWSTLCYVRGQLLEHRTYLETCQVKLSNGANPDLSKVSSSIESVHAKFLNMVRISKIASAFLSVWRPEKPVPIPPGIIKLLNRWPPDSALRDVLKAGGQIKNHLWANFPRSLAEAPQYLREATFTALWRLASFNLEESVDDDSHLTRLAATLDALSHVKSSFASSITPLMKLAILNAQSLHGGGSVGELLLSFKNGQIFPEESATAIPSELLDMNADKEIFYPTPQWWALDRCMGRRKDEAQIAIFAEYLEQCSSDDWPYKAAETLEKISHFINIRAPVHHTHQIRLADSVHKIFIADRDTGLLNAIVKCRCWNFYAEGPKTEEEIKGYREMLGSTWYIDRRLAWPWIDDPIAQKKIKDALTKYAGKLTSADSPQILDHVQDILQGLEYWHPGDEASNLKEVLLLSMRSVHWIGF